MMPHIRFIARSSSTFTCYVRLAVPFTSCISLQIDASRLMGELDLQGKNSLRLWVHRLFTSTTASQPSTQLRQMVSKQTLLGRTLLTALLKELQ